MLRGLLLKDAAELEIILNTLTTLYDPQIFKVLMGPFVIICVSMRVYVPNYVIESDLAQILFTPWSFNFVNFVFFWIAKCSN